MEKQRLNRLCMFIFVLSLFVWIFFTVGANLVDYAIDYTFDRSLATFGQEGELESYIVGTAKQSLKPALRNYLVTGQIPLLGTISNLLSVDDVMTDFVGSMIKQAVTSALNSLPSLTRTAFVTILYLWAYHPLVTQIALYVCVASAVLWYLTGGTLNGIKRNVNDIFSIFKERAGGQRKKVQQTRICKFPQNQQEEPVFPQSQAQKLPKCKNTRSQSIFLKILILFVFIVVLAFMTGFFPKKTQTNTTEQAVSHPQHFVASTFVPTATPDPYASLPDGLPYLTSIQTSQYSLNVYSEPNAISLRGTLLAWSSFDLYYYSDTWAYVMKTSSFKGFTRVDSTFLQVLQDAGISYLNISEKFSAANSSAFSNSLYGYVTERLSTRSGPGTVYSETGSYNNTLHSWVQVRSRAWDSRNGIWWVEVLIGDQWLWTGYKRFDSTSLPLESIPISSDYTSLSNDAIGTCIITADPGNAREGPGTEYKKIASVYKGSEYSILDTAVASNGRVWFKIKDGNLYCWISSGITNLGD